MQLLLHQPLGASGIMGMVVTVLVTILLQGVVCLRFIALDVPEAIFVGQVARLSCIFDEEHDDLYSVKWYKDDVEFFRFLPNDRPANQFFTIGDVDVDLSKSANGTVFLRNTSLAAQGHYRCEVSADAPSFQSISSEKYMSVEEWPKDIKNHPDVQLTTENEREEPAVLTTTDEGMLATTENSVISNELCTENMIVTLFRAFQIQTNQIITDKHKQLEEEIQKCVAQNAQINQTLDEIAFQQNEIKNQNIELKNENQILYMELLDTKRQLQDLLQRERGNV